MEIDDKINKFFRSFKNWLSGLENKYGLETNPYQLALCLDPNVEGIHQVYRIFLSFPNHWEWRGKKQIHGHGNGLEECLSDLAEAMGKQFDLSPLQIGEKPLTMLEWELRQIAELASSSDCKLVTISFYLDQQLDKDVVRISGDGLSDAMIFLDQRLRPFVEGKGQTIVEALAQAKSLLERFRQEAEEQKRGYHPWLLDWKRGGKKPIEDFASDPDDSK